MSNYSVQILNILRDGSNFQWYVIPLLSFVFYVYTVEVEKRNWNLVLAGLAFWGMDWFNEIVNGLVLHFSGYAPIWGTPGSSAFVILAGLNIEIMFMFAVSGIIWTKMLLPDKDAKILGINNRWVVAIAGSAFSVFVEYFLNLANALTWEYPWWNRGAPWLIFLFGYLTFFIVAFWVYDMDDFKKKIRVVGGIWAFDIICLILFIGVLGWI
ncbi:MAG: hypothetical protein B6I38_05395 [Anaerolineaceae bacterium 4572_5.1]|nr:MAG: hypothetical protein B5M51_01860 [Anaerolinea sp. 4484_236]OQY31756.1 MAG: hypothetical protein B6I38_05395 [Anaerolineaceae bacterium 4572_5.1]